MPWHSLHKSPAIAEDISLPLHSAAARSGILSLEENTMRQRNSDHAHDHTEVPSDPALRVKALESLLVEKGLVDPGALDVLVDTFELTRLSGTRRPFAFARRSRRSFRLKCEGGARRRPGPCARVSFAFRGATWRTAPCLAIV
jgi:hypothetical protein